MRRDLLIRVAESYVGEVEQTDIPAYLYKHVQEEGGKFEQAAGHLDSSLKAALRILDRLGDSEAQDQNSRILRARAIFQSGRVWLTAGKTQEAKARFEESLQVMPTPEAYYNLALCLDKLTPSPIFGSRKVEPMIDLYMKAIDLDPASNVAVAAAKAVIGLGGLEKL